MKEEREKTKNQKASRSTEREGKLLVQRGHDHVYRKSVIINFKSPKNY